MNLSDEGCPGINLRLNVSVFANGVHVSVKVQVFSDSPFLKN
jgi:hypothetical protein